MPIFSAGLRARNPDPHRETIVALLVARGAPTERLPAPPPYLPCPMCQGNGMALRDCPTCDGNGCVRHRRADR
jgi:hypothetical protein